MDAAGDRRWFWALLIAPHSRPSGLHLFKEHNDSEVPQLSWHCFASPLPSKGSVRK